jgi:hypothetical protein
MNIPQCYVEHTLPLLFRSAVDGLKVKMQGGGMFKERLIGRDYSVTIVYHELAEDFSELLRKLEDIEDACESGPVDKKYR